MSQTTIIQADVHNEVEFCPHVYTRIDTIPVDRLGPRGHEQRLIPVVMCDWLCGEPLEELL